MTPNWSNNQPFGLEELEVDAASRYLANVPGSLIQSDKVRCCVRDCNHWIARRRRGVNDSNAFCPVHGISVSTSPTYIYKDDSRNFIIDIEMLHQVKPLKVESWRLGNERSEDALSWNVFRGLSGLNSLSIALHSLTGIEIDTNPELYLWGIKVSDAQPHVWPRLLAIRHALEKGVGIPTEPDIILRVPGKVIVLIEAKFGSGNGTMAGQEDRFGAVADFLNRYPCMEGQADPLNRAWIEEQNPDQVLQQLVRNVIFAQWLAEDGEIPFVVNLVRDTEERNVAERMAFHLASNGPVKFLRATWENLLQLPFRSNKKTAAPLTHYFENKTNKLARAFQPCKL